MIYLKPSDDELIKKKLYGFDIETYGKYNKFLMGSIVNENEKYIFWNKKQMQDFILNSHKLRNSYIFATNLNFDFLALFGESIDLLMKFNYKIRNSEFINIKYKRKNYSINFLDTLNFARFSVKKLGQILKIPKLPKPSFLGKLSLNEIQKKKLEKYNVNDSYITFKFAEFLQNTFNRLNSNLQYTIASNSLDYFKRNCLKRWIRQPEKDILLLQYNAYYGGRVECFYRGHIRNKYYYDINSLYPFVMKEYDYPFPNIMDTSYINNGNINLINKYHGISYCHIIAPNDLFYPLLPYRFESKLIFPVGKFKGWYSHIELKKALELGYKIIPKKSIIYYASFNPFRKFVNELYNLRMKYKSEKNPMQLPVKILMNSLYGKFAQKIDTMEIMFIKNKDDLVKLNNLIDYNYELIKINKEIRYKIDTPKFENLIRKNNKLYENSKIYFITDLNREKYAKFINPILSLYITSYARLELYKLIELINKNYGTVYYCDTDSVITDLKLKTSNNLGDIKLEHKIDEGLIIKPKMYFIRDKIGNELCKAKGLHGLSNYTDFNNVITTKNYKYMKFTKFKESLRRNLHFNEKIEVVKNIDLEDNKRLWKNKEINIKILEKSNPLKANSLKAD